MLLLTSCRVGPADTHLSPALAAAYKPLYRLWAAVQGGGADSVVSADRWAACQDAVIHGGICQPLAKVVSWTGMCIASQLPSLSPPARSPAPPISRPTPCCLRAHKVVHVLGGPPGVLGGGAAAGITERGEAAIRWRQGQRRWLSLDGLDGKTLRNRNATVMPVWDPEVIWPCTAAHP